MSDVFQALSSPIRREILSVLKQKDMSAGELSDLFTVGKSTISGHLNVLKAADLVTSVRNGTTITYSLKTSVVEDLMSQLITLFDYKNN